MRFSAALDGFADGVQSLPRREWMCFLSRRLVIWDVEWQPWSVDNWLPLWCEVFMICVRCASSRKLFTSEIAIHFPGNDGLDRPLVRLFPKLEICFNCGTAEFFVPERERRVLIDGKDVGGAIVSK